MVTIHYYWVLRTEVAFEEASIVKAEKRAVKVAAMRAGKVRIGHTPPKAQRAPFNLMEKLAVICILFAAENDGLCGGHCGRSMYLGK